MSYEQLSGETEPKTFTVIARRQSGSPGSTKKALGVALLLCLASRLSLRNNCKRFGRRFAGQLFVGHSAYSNLVYHISLARRSVKNTVLACSFCFLRENVAFNGTPGEAVETRSPLLAPTGDDLSSIQNHMASM